MRKLFDKIVDNEVFLITFAVGFCLFLYFTKGGLGWLWKMIHG